MHKYKKGRGIYDHSALFDVNIIRITHFANITEVFYFPFFEFESFEKEILIELTLKIHFIHRLTEHMLFICFVSFLLIIIIRIIQNSEYKYENFRCATLYYIIITAGY